MALHEPNGGFITNLSDLLGIVQVVFLALLGYVWRKMARYEDGADGVKDSVSEVEREVLSMRADMHRDFVTKDDLREILEAHIQPMHESLTRVESKIDAHMQQFPISRVKLPHGGPYAKD